MRWDAELEVALRAADAALPILRARPRRVDHKSARDLVTDVDRRSEAAIREVLGQTGIPVLGEEEGGAEGATRWVVDPLDGTTNFVHGFPWYACSIALEVEGRVVVGVVAEAPRGLRHWATSGGGAYVEGERLAVSQVDRLDHALLATGFPYDRAERAEALLVPVRRALELAQGVRRAGAASLDLALVARGCLDAYWEHDLGPWDVAAGSLLVEEAGGKVSTHTGETPPGLIVSPLATNGQLHDAMIRLLEGA